MIFDKFKHQGNHYLAPEIGLFYCPGRFPNDCFQSIPPPR